MASVQVGMSADEVLRLLGYGKSSAVRPPKIVGQDEQGLTVRWFYPDVVLTLQRAEGRYRVVEIKERNLLGKLWWGFVRGEK